MRHRSSLFCLLWCISACQSKAPEDPVGAVYYESWVFVGRGSEQEPLVASLSIRKSQQSKKRVEIESKLFMSKERQTRLIFYDKKTKGGNVREVSSADPIAFKETPCNQQTCLSIEISRGFFLQIQSDPLPPLTPHSWHDTRIGDAVTTATLSLEQLKTPGCLFVERGVSLTKSPEPFFGDFDWFALLDDKGECWLVSDGSRVGGFALSKGGISSTQVERQGEAFFLDPKSGQQVSAAWRVGVPQLSWEATLSALEGHRGLGAKLPSGKSTFFGQGAVEGSIQISGEIRQCVGWVQHIQDQ